MTNPQPTAFSCPDNYRKISLGANSVPNANLSLVTDDNIATLTVKTPQTGLKDVTICLGTPNPLPTGVKADYAYEVKTNGDYAHLLNPQLKVAFTLPSTMYANPILETVQSTANGVTYTVARNDVSTVNGTNASITADVPAAGLYVVRLVPLKP
ncbi:hypothetical protein SGO26_08130 [Cupriavidus metallidurans]|uniref:hypothetical protein n=1 Tax=Cupriavidus TaxID=106589 RepID=UPI0002A43595|nr:MULTISPECIES: hypothetical protein [Cupriavidus]EKZ99395.1 hypothetical protein D769_10461 [Cupriavidus sp. HMR-1]HBD39813.1 hypothetical protein [Cupriavidus sp.]